jgi:hypothetical protein
VADAVSYDWTIPPGATLINSGYWWNYHWITVQFGPGSLSGNVSVRALNACGPGVGASLAVTLHDVPEVAIGPDIYLAYGDSVQLNALVTTGTPPYSYYWSPWWIMDDHTIPNPWMYGTISANVSLTVTDTFGCTATDQLLLTTGPPGGSVSGYITYDNAASSPMANSTVLLDSAGAATFADTTGASGDYSFVGVGPGQYRLSVAPAKPWDGVNATDALLIMRHFVDQQYLYGMKASAADVNGSAFINAVDALLCAQRFTGNISSFPVGDWLFEDVVFTHSGSGMRSFNLRGICYGDVDGSHVPGLKAAPSVSLGQTGSITMVPSGSASVPVRAASAMGPAAISLVLKVPAGYTINAVRMKDKAPGTLIYHVAGDQLRIAWFSIEPMWFESGDDVFILDVAYRSIPQSQWSIGNESAVADAMGRQVKDAAFVIPAPARLNGGFAFGQCYPNPFRQTATIPFSLPAAAKVKISILNMPGEEIITVCEGNWLAGDHEVALNARRLAPGIYNCRMVAEAGGLRFEQVQKIIVAH